MHDEHGKAMTALQLAQVSEERRDFAAGIFIDPVQAYERIEQ